MYGQNQYGMQKYADFKGEGQQEDYYMNLFPLVPGFVSEKKEMHALYDVQGYEAGYLRHMVEDAVAQCFITSATWGLGRWEKVYNVETSRFLTYEQRREILQAKMGGQGTTTVSMLKEAAATFSGGEVEVVEDNANYCFTVRFVGIKGIPRNMQGFKEMLENIKPAHLACQFEYRYTIWSEVKELYRWRDLIGISWNQLRVLEEDKNVIDR